jgi:penicillin-binding protein 2
MLYRTAGSPQTPGVRARLHGFLALVVLVFAALVVRLAYLQIVKGPRYRSLSEDNRVRVQPVTAPRGKIFDRNGRLLVENRPAFNLMVVREDAENLEKTLRRLGQRVVVNQQVVRRRMKRVPPFRPVLVSRDIPRDTLAFVAEHKLGLPGLRVVVDPLRENEHGELAAHLLGYLGEINESQLAALRDKGYQVGDLIGQYGVERQYEAILRGRGGVRQVEVDAVGRELLQLEGRQPKPGFDLLLTINLKYQRLAEDLMADHNGVIIAMDPRNGEVLAFVSRPAFDPNLFSSGISEKAWKKLTENPDHPLQNRAIQGQYPPGSIFKIIVAAAALEEGVVTPDDSITCVGSHEFGDRVFRDWKEEGHGEVNLHKALVESCDVYFYRAGHAVGIDRLAAYARGFGLGAPTGIGLEHEKAGLVPDRAWKMKTKGKPWQPGETLGVAIGQGFNLVTPMQVAVIVSAIANGGTLLKPHLVREVRRPDGQVVEGIEPEVTGTLPVSPITLRLVREALRGVVNEPMGTGTRARLKGVVVAGKTGTAQVVQQRPDEEDEAFQEKLPKHLRDHAWFVAFAPFEDPSIALVVFIENAGRGGAHFASLARKLIRVHMGPRPKRLASGRRR